MDFIANNTPIVLQTISKVFNACTNKAHKVITTVTLFLDSVIQLEDDDTFELVEPVSPEPLDRFPFSRLFEHGDRNPLIASDLKHIRDRIYYFVWDSQRTNLKQDTDFVLDSWGITRNVHRKGWGGDGDNEGEDALKLIHWDTGLLFANKAISQDFARYIYSVNTVGIYLPIHARPHVLSGGCMREGQLRETLSRFEMPNKRLFAKYTRDVVVVIEDVSGDDEDLYGDWFYDEDVDGERSPLAIVCEALSGWRFGEPYDNESDDRTLHVKAILGRPEEDDKENEERRLWNASRPFYPLPFTE
ncbi:hypothetical protein B0T10DRAFT_604289 [Thelonectria olida]|uniref:Uncharacterized protein n=1 Tax=Thelonectria olida TaxID=1576542 RepID=A0A9P8W899_9HYPO|nr:hypothetical protein B0T10DRAFT_604289 [Thelonectria olida]